MLRYGKVKGIVLFFVLMILQMIMLLSLFVMRAVLFEKRMVQYDFAQRMVASQGEIILARVERNVLQGQPDCLMPMMLPANLLVKPLSWWQSFTSCAGIFQGFQYYYVVETLGEDVCASLINAQAVADYYRVTVFLQSPQSSQPFYLQSTIVKPAQVSLACEGTRHNVIVGRQSWRIVK